MLNHNFDCIIIGGGPAGLTAALYLARYRRKVRVIDNGGCRANRVPVSHNVPAFPNGIRGQDLLDRMRRHAKACGASFSQGFVSDLWRNGELFCVITRNEIDFAPAVLLATGVTNRKPSLGARPYARAVANGLIRYYPACDGYEARGQRIAVLGMDGHGVAEALILRTYSPHVTLLASRAPGISEEDRALLVSAGIAIIDRPVAAIALKKNSLRIMVESDPDPLYFDTLYPVLGFTANAFLARRVEATVREDGCLNVDQRQQTTVDMLYAAGNVVDGLNQIGVAMGQGVVASTAIHNALRERQRTN